MNIYSVFDDSGTSSSFCRIISEICKNKQVKSLMILSCDKNDLDISLINSYLADVPVKVFGGLFPAVIYKGEMYEKGTVFLAYQSDCKIITINDLDEPFEEILEDEYNNLRSFNTSFVFIDGMSLKISKFLDTIFDVLGLSSNFIGGGAGSLSLVQKPCIFSNAGVLQNAAQLAFFEMISGVGVAHGWYEVDGPYLVTGAEDNTILSLDMQPAMDIYRQIVEKHSGQVMNEDNFFSIAKDYPFGITKLGSENVIRDPVRVNSDNSITCVGNIPSQGFMHIMTGSGETLKKAALQALKKARLNYPDTLDDYMLFHMECISRALFLGDDFQNELEMIHDGETLYIGALPLGEIANSRQDYLEFHNKSSVFGLWKV